MRYLLECLEGLAYLTEADAKRDRDLRNKAVGFYNDLIKYLKKNKDRMFGKEKDLKPIADQWRADNPGQDMPFEVAMSLSNKSHEDMVVHARKFWADPDAKKLSVGFYVVDRNRAGSMAGNKFNGYISGDNAYMRLNIIPKGVGEMSGSALVGAIPKETVIHEFMHFMDKGSNRMSKKYKIPKLDDKDKSDYYNEPTEWQAFYQQGAEAAERELERAASSFWTGGYREEWTTTYRQFRKNILGHWRQDWLNGLNDKYRRKFEKRVAGMWGDWEKWMKQAANTSDDVMAAVEHGFKDSEKDFVPPGRTPNGRARHNKKREAANAKLIVDSIANRLGKYKKYMDRAEVESLLADTYHPDSMFNWNGEYLRHYTIAVKIAEPIIRRATGRR